MPYDFVAALRLEVEATIAPAMFYSCGSLADHEALACRNARGGLWSLRSINHHSPLNTRCLASAGCLLFRGVRESATVLTTENSPVRSTAQKMPKCQNGL